MDFTALTRQGGLGAMTTKSVKNVNLPPRTKCVICQRVKLLQQYSSKQVDQLRSKIYKSGQANAVPREGLLRCIDCTGGQNMEMECQKCMVVRPLEDFSRAQRARKDDAICSMCMEAVQLWDVDTRQFNPGENNPQASNHGRAREDDGSENIYLWDRDTGDYSVGDAASSAFSVAGGVALPSIGSRSLASGGDPFKSSAASLTSALTTKSTSSSRSRPESSVVGSASWLQSQGSRRAGELTAANLQQLNINSDNTALVPSASRGGRVQPNIFEQAAAAKKTQDWQQFPRGSNSSSAVSGSDDCSSEAPGRLFRSYDATGAMRVQGQLPASRVSDNGSDDDRTVYSQSTTDDNRRFPRVRPINKPVRRFKKPEHEDEIFGKPHDGPVSINVMEDDSSDED